MSQKTIAPRKDISALDAKFEAQKLSFAPVAFQCARVLRDKGILKLISDAGKEGISAREIHEKSGVSLYGVKVLLDMAASLMLVDYIEEERYVLMKTGYFILNDKMSNVNMDFIHDVCYQGLFYLGEAIDKQKPSGLKVFGEWETIYDALSELPEKVRESWFAFDHFYSDNAFPKALEIVFSEKPAKLFDVGGNTGRWALECVKYDPDVEVTILDLPGQLRDAEKTAKENGFENRIKGYEINLLDENQKFPEGADAIWMSQFLDCFSEEQILSILNRAREAMDSGTKLYIMETYWDRQRFEAATYSLNATSLYFTAMANGNSRMYHSKDMIKQVHRAGLVVDQDTDEVGLGHTLFRCKLA
ncbi:MAG: methyltransferase [Chitinophagales bacterium]